MPKTTFVKGSKLTSAWVQAMQNLVFDGQDLDGHYPKITDNQLDDSANSLLTNWKNFTNSLAVVSVTGLTANYNGGVISLSNGMTFAIVSGTILLADNSTNYIFINRNGVVSTGLSIPPISIPLAKIVTVGGTISGNITDLRPRYTITPLAQAIKVFGGLGGQNAYNLTSGSDTLTGENYFTDFNVSAGATLTISGTATIYCSGNVTISGTINVTPTVKGGSAYNGYFLLQDYPAYGGYGFGGGNGVNIVPSATYHYSTSPVGSGGAGGWLRISSNTANGGLTGVRGGNGGGNVIFETAGSINITGSILCNGENGQDASNIVMNPPNAYTGLFPGGGGGSGGLILLKSLTSITAYPSSVLSVKGGNGGNGYPNPASFNSAGGGGGGYIVCYSPTNNLTGATINLSGGTAQYSNQLNGSVSGGSYAGLGGYAGQNGANGSLVLKSIVPV